MTIARISSTLVHLIRRIEGIHNIETIANKLAPLTLLNANLRGTPAMYAT